MKLFQITEDDLAELERLLPQLSETISFAADVDPRTRTQLTRVRLILSNVRWNYGPPTEVERVDP